MNSGFFSIDNDGNLNDVSEVAFSTEDALQELVAKYPRLLSGDEGSANDMTEWLFIAREVGIPSQEGQADRWAVDHLFLDREGVPTLVEVKRSSDSRIRREVVGQLLDYAANASIHWPVETIKNSFDATCVSKSRDPDEALAEFLGHDPDTELFWKRVKTNLQAGKMRLIFLADELPLELRTVIEFLNRQMDPTEVIGVEIKQYGSDDFKALTSRVIGRTADVVQRKTTRGRLWDEESFLNEITKHGGSGDAALAKRLLDWSNQQGLGVWWGRGRLHGSFYPILEIDGLSYPTYGIWTDSQIEIQFYTLQKRRQFDGEEKRLELLRRLNTIPLVQINESRITGFPKFPLNAIMDENSLTKFFEVFNWVITTIKDDLSVST